MLASVSKVFTGSAVALLLDQGIIRSLDEDICESIPSTWSREACRNPQFPDTNVTWRMLVTHRSSMANDIPYVVLPNGSEVQASYGPSNYKDEDGIPSFGNPTCSLRDVQNFYHAAMTSDPEASTTVGGGSIDWYQEFQKQEQGPWKNYRPGSIGGEEGYSNFAYGYIAALIEMKTGKSFAEYCKNELFQRLGMTHTAWFREDLPNQTQQAIPVIAVEEDAYKEVGHYCFIDYASGQLYSTASDMAKFLSSMLDHGTNLWSSEIAETVFSCQEQNESGDPISQSECEFGVSWILLSNSMKDSLYDYYLEWLEPFTRFDWTGGKSKRYCFVSKSFHQTNGRVYVVFWKQVPCTTVPNWVLALLFLVLPKAQMYVSVLINTESEDASPEWIAYAVGDASSSTCTRRLPMFITMVLWIVFFVSIF